MVEVHTRTQHHLYLPVVVIWTLLGKLLGLKFVFRKTAPGSWKLLGVCHVGTNNSFLCGRCCSQGRSLEEKRCVVKLDDCNWLTALVLSFCSPCNSVQLLRLDFSGFSYNKVFSLDIFKGHYFKLKSWNGERNYFHRIFTTQELNKLTHWTDTVDSATEL